MLFISQNVCLNRVYSNFQNIDSELEVKFRNTMCLNSCNQPVF